MKSTTNDRKWDAFREIDNPLDDKKMVLVSEKLLSDLESGNVSAASVLDWVVKDYAEQGYKGIGLINKSLEKIDSVLGTAMITCFLLHPSESYATSSQIKNFMKQIRLRYDELLLEVFDD